MPYNPPTSFPFCHVSALRAKPSSCSLLYASIMSGCIQVPWPSPRSACLHDSITSRKALLIVNKMAVYAAPVSYWQKRTVFPEITRSGDQGSTNRWVRSRYTREKYPFGMHQVNMPAQVSSHGKQSIRIGLFNRRKIYDCPGINIS